MAKSSFAPPTFGDEIEMEVPEMLEPFKKDLVAMHHLEYTVILFYHLVIRSTWEDGTKRNQERLMLTH